MKKQQRSIAGRTCRLSSLERVTEMTAGRRTIDSPALERDPAPFRRLGRRGWRHVRDRTGSFRHAAVLDLVHGDIVVLQDRAFCQIELQFGLRVGGHRRDFGLPRGGQVGLVLDDQVGGRGAQFVFLLFRVQNLLRDGAGLGRGG